MRGVPRSSVGKASVCNVGRPGFNSWVRKFPWRRKRHPTLVFLPGESHGQRSLAGYSSWAHKSQTQLSAIFLSFFLSFLKQIKVRDICHTESGITRDEQALLRVSGPEN